MKKIENLTEEDKKAFKPVVIYIKGASSLYFSGVTYRNGFPQFFRGRKKAKVFSFAEGSITMNAINKKWRRYYAKNPGIPNVYVDLKSA